MVFPGRTDLSLAYMSMFFSWMFPKMYPILSNRKSGCFDVFFSCATKRKCRTACLICLLDAYSCAVCLFLGPSLTDVSSTNFNFPSFPLLLFFLSVEYINISQEEMAHIPLKMPHIARKKYFGLSYFRAGKQDESIAWNWLMDFCDCLKINQNGWCFRRKEGNDYLMVHRNCRGPR